MQFLLKKKQWWFALAHDDPERIFESFDNSSLTKLTDEYGNDYVFEVLAEATKNEPELAFKYIDNYKNWKDKKFHLVGRIVYAQHYPSAESIGEGRVCLPDTSGDTLED